VGQCPTWWSPWRT